MFCPKCGVQNPETGKFCRSCGTDLGNVSAVISGNLPANLSDRGLRKGRRDRYRNLDKHEIFAAAVRNIISGFGFLIISLVLFLTNVAGGHAWWWAMLFPGFAMLARGISEIIRYGMMEGDAQQKRELAGQTENALGEQPVNRSLPASQTEYVSPDSRYKTGDLVPPSVTDSTTRHLEINTEGETMALPKK